MWICGGDAVDLGALAVGPVELLNRQLQGTRLGWAAATAADVLADHDDLLDRALTEGAGVADDQPAAVVLDHARENLRSTGAEFVDQDDERAVPGGAFVVVVKMPDAEDFLDLDDRAGVDEQAGERLGFVEQAAAVAAEVERRRRRRR